MRPSTLWGMGAALLLTSACYHHQAAHQPARVTASGLPQARVGHYTLWRDGRQVGREDVEVRTSSAGWALTSTIRWREPIPVLAAYRLRVQEDEPRELSARLELMGQARTLTASVGAGYLHGQVAGVGGARRRKVAYAAGTALDVLSPVARTWMLGLLSPRLLPGATVEVRTIRVQAPSFEAKVELQALVVEKAQGDLRLVRLKRPAPAPPEALWLDPEGFVVRARTWPRGASQPFVERRWQPREATGPRAGSATPAPRSPW